MDDARNEAPQRCYARARRPARHPIFIERKFFHWMTIGILSLRYVAWVGDSTPMGLVDALATWFGPRAAD